MSTRFLFVSVAALALAGCIESDAVQCAGGVVCPSGQVCSPLGGCAFQDQLDQCDRQVDGTTCTLEGASAAACFGGVCLSIGCGNSIVEPGEACDDGNIDSGDGCSARCDSTERCGNAFLDSIGAEQCDCGDAAFTGARPAGCNGPNSDDVDSICLADCRLRGCGDGVVGALEECDGTALPLSACEDVGFYSGALSCSPTCRYDVSACTGRCGDGVRNGPAGGQLEQCDGTDLAAVDCTDFGYYQAAGLACTSFCSFATGACTGGICGDDTVDAAEDCEPDLGVGTRDCTDFGFYKPGGLACGAACGYDLQACVERCGDELVNGTETCDGAPPPELSCTFAGYGAGQLGCANGCYTSVEHCQYVGLHAESLGGQFELSAVWGIGTDFWIVGLDGLVFHTTGGPWAQVDIGALGALYGVWGSSATNVYAVGNAEQDGTSIHHYDGISWSNITAPTGGVGMHAVWGSGANDVWVVGEQATAVRYNGTTWQAVTLPVASTIELSGVWGSGPSDVFIVGTEGHILHWNGLAWSDQIVSTAAFNTVWGLGANDVYVAGGSQILHSTNGSTWTAMTSCSAGTIHSIGGSPGGLILAAGSDPVGNGIVCQLAGGNWFRVSPTGTPKNFEGVGASSERTYVVGNAAVRRGDRAAWVTIPTTLPVLGASGVWGTAGNDIYAVGEIGVRHFDGTSWTVQTVNGTNIRLSSIAGASATDVVAVGVSAYRLSGTSWTEIPAGVSSLNDVWATAPTNFIAVGSAGTIRRYDGSSWSTQTSGTTETLNAVWGASDSAVFAVGTNGTIRFWNGSTWTGLSSGTNDQLNDVWGRSATDVYVASNDGSILHYDGSAWRRTPTGLGACDHVWGAGSHVFVTGNSEIRQFAGGRWLPVALPVESFTTVDVWGTGDLTIFVSGTSEQPLVLAGSLSRAEPNESRCLDYWDDDLDGLVDCADPDCALDEQCEQGGGCRPLIDLACNSSVNATTVGGALHWPYFAGAGCSPRIAGGREAYFRVRRATTGSIALSLTGYSGDLDLIVTPTSADGACLPDNACVAESRTTSTTEAASFTATGGSDYIVIVDAASTGASSAFSLAVSCP